MWHSNLAFSAVMINVSTTTSVICKNYQPHYSEFVYVPLNIIHCTESCYSTHKHTLSKCGVYTHDDDEINQHSSNFIHAEGVEKNDVF